MGILETVTKTMFSSTSDKPQTEQSGLLGGILALINSPQIGGLQGLMDKFKAAGLGQAAESWVANGPNPPITADQLRKAIPADQLSGIAKQLGTDVDGASQQLAESLPHVVDNLTPDGKLPAEEMDPAAMLAMLKQKFFG
ncbi:MAG: YidB family protein [Planctomycetes bacterium]|nr:YidB family protein [Planctomycetota bacterium]